MPNKKASYEKKLNPAIYVACSRTRKRYLFPKSIFDLPYGAWIPATLKPEEMQYMIDKMLQSSPTPNATDWEIYATNDFDNVLGIPVKYKDLAVIARLGTAIADFGKAFIAYAEYRRRLGIEPSVEEFEESYKGEYEYEAMFVESYAEKVYYVPDCLREYIDYFKMAEDWFNYNCYSIPSDNGCYCFYLPIDHAPNCA